MVAYAAPGAYFETRDRAPRGVAPLRTDIAAFVGLAERGPVDQPTKVESWEQFRSRFGGFTASAFLAYAVKAFFDNGGRTCYVVRVAAPAVTVASVPVPPAVPPDRGQVVVADAIEAFVPGAAVTLRQERRDATGLVGVEVQLAAVTARDPATGALAILPPLAERLDPHLPMTVATGAGAATTTVADASGRPALEIRASSPGAWGNHLAVRVSRFAPAATSLAARAQPPEGTAVHVDRVAGIEPATLLRIVQDTGAGVVERHRFVAAIDPLRGLVTFDEPLDAAFDTTRTASVETVEFSVSVHEDGRLREVVGGLSLHPDHPRYVLSGDLGAAHVAFALPDGTIPPSPLPAPGGADEVAARLPVAGPPQALAGGRDGLAGLTVLDLTGEGIAQRHGLRTLELVDEVAIVALPDAHVVPRPDVLRAPLPEPEPDPCCPSEPDPVAVPLPSPMVDEQPPAFTLDEIHRAQQRLVEHCETQRDRVAVLDAPRGLDAAEVAAWRRRFDTSWAALYHPWVAVLDPRGAAPEPARFVPPSGHVCGVYAKGDLTVGVHRAPANLGLAWAQDVAAVIDEATQEVLNPLGVNCLRTVTARGLQVYGARTLSSDPAWRFVNVRRLLAMIAESLLAAVQWAVFEPHDRRLRQLLSLAATSFLRALWQAGALAGERPEDAFFVRCDETTNPPEVVGAGQLRVEIGVAPTLPAEFVVVRIGRVDNEWKVLA